MDDLQNDLHVSEYVMMISFLNKRYYKSNFF